MALSAVSTSIHGLQQEDLQVHRLHFMRDWQHGDGAHEGGRIAFWLVKHAMGQAAVARRSAEQPLGS